MNEQEKENPKKTWNLRETNKHWTTLFENVLLLGRFTCSLCISSTFVPFLIINKVRSKAKYVLKCILFVFTISMIGAWVLIACRIDPSGLATLNVPVASEDSHPTDFLSFKGLFFFAICNPIL